MLDARKTVPLPDKGVQVYAKNGRRYAYKVTRTYRNAKGKPTCDRRSIGRVDDETGMLIPNLAYYEFYGDSAIAAAAPQPQVGAVFEAGVAFAARVRSRRAERWRCWSRRSASRAPPRCSRSPRTCSPRAT